MKLRNAAKYFDQDSVYDAYTGVLLFKGQWSNYDSSRPDGSFERRRTVSVAPGILPAPRRAVIIGGETWLMGELVNDTFKNRHIRQTCSAKKVTDEFMLLTPGQAALRATAPTLYGHTKYLKDTVNSVTSSDYTPFYDVSIGSTEPLFDGAFLKSKSLFLHVRSAYKELEGFWNAASDEVAYDTPDPIGNPPRSCEVTANFAGAINPVTETVGASTSIPGIVLPMYMLYNYRTQDDSLNRQGDISLIVAKSSITPVVGTAVGINGESWRVFRYTSYQDAWNIHLRKA